MASTAQGYVSGWAAGCDGLLLVLMPAQASPALPPPQDSRSSRKVPSHESLVFPYSLLGKVPCFLLAPLEAGSWPVLLGTADPECITQRD